MVTLLPAYGRSYKRKADAQSDLDADKDFIESHSDKPINRPQLREMGLSRVTLRYGREGRKLTTLVVRDERRDPPDETEDMARKLTMRRFRSLSAKYAGYCSNCKRIKPSARVEPDAEGYDCKQCNQQTLCGIEHAVLSGLLEVTE